MPLYSYRAVDAGGKRANGSLSAASASAATLELEGQGLLPIEVEEARAKRQGSAGFGFGRRAAVLDFTRSLAALLPAGMPLTRALAASAATSPEAIRPALDQVRARVERGDELAAALAEHPALFSSLYVGVVRAGERSGSLDTSFTRLADYLEREAELASKLVSMSIYPILLGLVGLGAVLALVLFVVPRFAALLLSAGNALPPMTALVVTVAGAARAHWPLLLLIPVAVALAAAWIRSTEGGQRFGSRALLSLPVVGAWRRQTLAARFARMVGELVAGGAPLLVALKDAHDYMTDPLMREETDRVRTLVREGSTLNGAIARGGLLPDALTQMVQLGEESGHLGSFLLKAADLLEKRTERALERMVRLVEPAMIVLFGGLVAIVALALLQAIYGINARSF